jgi:DNA-binding IclR family transcriptional regulator
MPQELLDRFLAQPSLRALTKNTVRKRDIMEKIEEIRATGVARSVGGQEAGAMGFGAAVFDASGQLRCAIAAGGPVARVRSKEREFRRLVLQTAEEMSRILGYQGEYPPHWPAKTVAPRLIAQES